MQQLIYICVLLMQRCCATMPYWQWYTTPEEEVSYVNGRVSTLACPVSTAVSHNTNVHEHNAIFERALLSTSHK